MDYIPVKEFLAFFLALSLKRIPDRACRSSEVRLRFNKYFLFLDKKYFAEGCVAYNISMKNRFVQYKKINTVFLFLLYN